jgi:hypothetical protein
MHKLKANHVRRTFNDSAHYLAKEALSISEEHGLLEEVFQCIFDFISMSVVLN